MKFLNCSQAAFLLLFTLLFTATFFSGCGDDDEDPEPENTLKIGVMLPLGANLSISQMGEGGRSAISMAAQEINNAGGLLGQQVELVFGDTQLDGAIATGTANDLLNQGCVALLGPMASGVATALANDVAIVRNVPLIGLACTSPALSDLDDANNMFWRTALSDIVSGEAMAEHCYNEGRRTVSILHIDNPYGSGMAQQFRQKFEELGGQVVDFSNYPDESETGFEGYNFADEVSSSLRQDPDAVLVVGYIADGQLILQAMQSDPSGNLPDAIYCPDSWQAKDLYDNADPSLTSLIVGSINSPPVTPDSTFYQQMVAFDQIPPGPYSSNSYDAMYVLALAIEKAQSTDANAIIAAISQIANSGAGKTPVEPTQFAQAKTAIANGEEIDYRGYSGPIEFAPNGDLSSGYVQIWKFEDNGTNTPWTPISSVLVGN